MRMLNRRHIVSKTKKTLLILLVIFLFILAGVVILMYSFTQGMKGDPVEEKKVRVQAEQYLVEYFKEETHVYDVLYDNMGNFDEFEYAAKVREEKYGTEFLVYSNVHTGKMEDSFISDKWRNDLEKEIKPYIEEKIGDVKSSVEMKEITDSNNYEEIQAKIGDSSELVVLFDREIGRELAIDPNHPKSYKEYDVAPFIHLTIHRKKQDSDENDFNSMIQSIKTDGALVHGELIVNYDSTDGVSLEDDEWRKAF